jgi:hypothetical protein
MGCTMCNNKKPQTTKETFNNKSYNWIYIVIILIIIIFLIYFLILKPECKMQEFVLAPPGFIRGHLDNYVVNM